MGFLARHRYGVFDRDGVVIDQDFLDQQTENFLARFDVESIRCGL